MEELIEQLHELDRLGEELRRVSILKKAGVGERMAQHSMDMTRHAFSVMQGFEARLSVLEAQKRKK